jgi:HAAS
VGGVFGRDTVDIGVGAMSADDLIDRYLDSLVEAMNGPGRQIRRALAESEDHLRQATADGVESGMNHEEAARTAIERFGSPELVARRYDLLRTLASPAQIAMQAVLALWLVAAFVLIGVGISGGVAAAGAVLYGPEFISGDLPGVTYTAERCADYLEYHPEAADCMAAAVAHHLDETVGTRVDAGILGLLLLAGWWVTKRSLRSRIGPSAIPALFVPIATLTLFAGAFVLLGGLGTLQLMSTGWHNGAGSFVSAGLVSLLAVVLFGLWIVRNLRSARR